MVKSSSVIPPQKNIITRGSKMRQIKKEIETKEAGVIFSLETASKNTLGYYRYSDTDIIKIAEFPAIYVRDENKYYWSPCQVPQVKDLSTLDGFCGPLCKFVIESLFNKKIIFDLLKVTNDKNNNNEGPGGKNFDMITKIKDAWNNNQLDKISLSLDNLYDSTGNLLNLNPNYRPTVSNFPITTIANTKYCGPGIINKNDLNSLLEPYR